MLNLRTLANGNLELRLDLAAEGVEQFKIEHRMRTLKFYDLMTALFEPYASSGHFEHFNGTGRMYIPLHHADGAARAYEKPCIASGLEYLSDSRMILMGDLWYLTFYDLDEDLDLFFEGQPIIYRKAT